MNDLEERFVEVLKNNTVNTSRSHVEIAGDLLALLPKIEVDCPKCGGTGIPKTARMDRHIVDSSQCRTCNGNKKITKTPEIGDVGRIVKQ